MLKTIGLPEDAYDRLEKLKQDGESFADVIRRLTGANLLARLAGTMDEKTAQHYRRSIRELRDRADAEGQHRYARRRD